jgi:hypothetical protein
MNKHKNEPTQKSAEALLARVEKEMDEPRMAESAREEDPQPDHVAEDGKNDLIQRGKELRAARRHGHAAEANG